MSIKFRILAAVCTSFFFSMFMSFAMAAVNVGFGPVFLSAWLRAWPIGFAIAIPVAFFLPQTVIKILRKTGIK